MRIRRGRSVGVDLEAPVRLGRGGMRVLLSASFTMALVSCVGWSGTRPQIGGEAAGSGEGDGTPREMSSDARGERVLPVRALWIRAQGRTLERLGLGAGATHAVLSEAERDDLLVLLAELSDVQVRPLALLAHQGASARMADVAIRSYVRDWELVHASADGGFSPRPTVGVLHVGRTLELSARWKDGRVELSGLTPQVADVAEARRFAASLVRDGNEWAIEWEEPTFVLARADSRLPKRFVLSVGESLLVRLRSQVVETPALVRESPFVREVREQGHAGAGSRGRSPDLSSEHLAVLISVSPLRVD